MLQCVLQCGAVRRSVLQCVEDADLELCDNVTIVFLFSFSCTKALKTRIQDLYDPVT